MRALSSPSEDGGFPRQTHKAIGFARVKESDQLSLISRLPDALLPIQLRSWPVFTLPTAVKVIGNPFVLLLVATDRTVIHFDEGELHDALCEIPFAVVNLAS